MQTFRDNYHQALALKALDVEEVIDVRFHRPVAAAITVFLARLPIKPNHITLMSLISGWMGAYFLYQASFHAMDYGRWVWGVAAFFLFGSVILDCADGQLARMKGGGTRVGRILDGLVDTLVLLPVYVILGFAIKELHGMAWFVVAAIAGFSTWIHCIIYDKLKNLYLANTVPTSGEGDGTETAEAVHSEFLQAKAKGARLDIVLLWIYGHYLQVQEKFASGSTEIRRNTLTDDTIKVYRTANMGTMRLASWLGLGTHLFLIYSAIALAAIYPPSLLILQLIFAAIFNAIMAVVLVRSRGFSK